MTRHEAHERHHHDHQEVWVLLPWYVNGTLDSREHEAVETHLSTCLACQAELRQCRDLSAAVQIAEEPVWSPALGDASQVLTRIDAAEARGAHDRSWWARLRTHGASPLRTLQRTPRPVRWTLAMQGAMILLLVGVLVGSGPLLPGPRYRTLYEPLPPGALYRTLTDGREQANCAPAPQGQTRLQVVFSDDITAQELRALLTSVGGTIVHGPSALGVYTVEASVSGGTRALVGPVLAAMRAHPKVRMAEPMNPH